MRTKGEVMGMGGNGNSGGRNVTLVVELVLEHGTPQTTIL